MGSLLWDVLDVVTFGAFEKKGAKKKPSYVPPGTNQTDN